MTPRKTTGTPTQRASTLPTPKSPRKSSPAAIRDTQRRADAVRMRIEGKTFEEIADKLGFSDRSAAFRSVMAARKEILREPTEQMVDLEISRLERLIDKTWTVIEEAEISGDGELLLKAIDRGARLSESRRKLLGLDAPAKSDVTSGGEATQVVFHTALNPDTT